MCFGRADPAGNPRITLIMCFGRADPAGNPRITVILISLRDLISLISLTGGGGSKTLTALKIPTLLKILTALKSLHL